MPRPYSADLHERVLEACERGEGSQEEIARRLKVCSATVLELATDCARGGSAGGQASQRRGAFPAGCAGPCGPVRPRHRGQPRHPLRIRRTLGGTHRRAGERSGAVRGAQAPEAQAQKKTLRAAEQDRPEIAAERERYREQIAEISV